jgi:hypothetical protein
MKTSTYIFARVFVALFTVAALQSCATRSTRLAEQPAPLMGNCSAMAASDRPVKAASGTRGLAYANARCYNRADLDRVGSIDIADALRRLDPSIH